MRFYFVSEKDFGYAFSRIRGSVPLFVCLNCRDFMLFMWL